MPFFVHLPIDEHLGRFYLLDIENSDFRNICIHVLFEYFFSILGNTYLEEELVAHFVILCLNF